MDIDIYIYLSISNLGANAEPIISGLGTVAGAALTVVLALCARRF